MGTTYSLIKKHGLEVDLDEHSCLFDLDINCEVNNTYSQITVSNLTPEQVIETALKMLQAASYFVEGAGETVDAAIIAFKKRAGGW